MISVLPIFYMQGWKHVDMSMGMGAWGHEHGAWGWEHRNRTVKHFFLVVFCEKNLSIDFSFFQCEQLPSMGRRVWGGEHRACGREHGNGRVNKFFSGSLLSNIFIK